MKFLAVLQLIAVILLLQDRVQQLEAHDHDDDHHGSYHHHHHHDHDDDDDHHDQRGMCGCRGGRRGDDDDKASCVYNGVTRAHRSHFLAEDGCNNCTCCNGQLECTTKSCSTLGCTSWDGTLVSKDESYLDSRHSCVSCSCANVYEESATLGLMCPMPDCLMPKCKFWEKVGGPRGQGCCPSCEFDAKRLALYAGGSVGGIVLIIVLAVLIAKRKKLRSCCRKKSVYLPMQDVPFQKVKLEDNDLPEKKPLA